jgi:hypothetical protein
VSSTENWILVSKDGEPDRKWWAHLLWVPAANLLVIGVYCLGYPEFRGPQVPLVVEGVGAQSLHTFITGSPVAVVAGHLAMRVTAVLYGSSSASQLPPHY